MIHRFLIYDRKFNCRVDRRYPLNQFTSYNQQQLQLHQQQQHSQISNLSVNKKAPNLSVADENSEISLNISGEDDKFWNIVTIESDESEAEAEDNGLSVEFRRFGLSEGPVVKDKEVVEHSQQLILGMTHSLKNMFTKLAPNIPKPHSDSGTVNIEGHSFSMKTSKYRLIYFESFTGWKLVLLTDCPPPSQQLQQQNLITLPSGIGVNSETALKAFYTQVLQKFVLTYPLGKIYATGEGPVDEDMLKRAGFLVKMDEFVHWIDKLF